MNLVKTSFDIPKELHKAFRRMCLDLDLKMNVVIREIMNKWLITQQNKEVGEKWKKPSLKN